MPEGRGSGHERVKEREGTETDGGAESRIEISRRGAGARREKIQKIVCLGFYSRGLASLAGQGGFAADLGRFGETTLPFFSMGADALPPEGARGRNALKMILPHAKIQPLLDFWNERSPSGFR